MHNVVLRLLMIFVCTNWGEIFINGLKRSVKHTSLQHCNPWLVKAQIWWFFYHLLRDAGRIFVIKCC